MKRAFIIHGYGGHPEEGWRPWLRDALTEQGVAVSIPSLPDTDHPVRESWQRALSETVGTPDLQTILIGHSLGCITILRYLESLPPEQMIGGAVLVSAFHRPLDSRFDAIRPFVEDPVDWERVRLHCPAFRVIHGDDDPYIPLSSSRDISRNLDTATLVIPHGKHLSASDGLRIFPPVLHACQALLSPSE